MPKAFMIGTARGALTVKQLIRERLNESKGSPKGQGPTWDSWTTPDGKTAFPGRKTTPGRAYLIIPKTTIPGAVVISSTGRLRLGTGVARVFRRYGNTEAADWHEYQDGSYLTTNNVVDPYNTADPTEVRVYNLCPDPIVVDSSGSDCNLPVCFAVQDMWGDLYIVKECNFPCYSSSSSTSSSSTSSSSSGSTPSSSSSSSSKLSSSGSACSWSGTFDVVSALTLSGCKLTVSKKIVTVEDGDVCNVEDQEDEDLDLSDCCCGSSSGSGGSF